MNTPRILPVGEELPPLHESSPPERPARRPDRNRIKGRPTDDRRKTKDRFGVINAFVDVTMAELRPCERAVWLILWRDTQPDGLARTSQADIARRGGASERAVRTALGVLVAKGLVKVIHKGGVNVGASVYRVRATVRRD